MIGDIFPDLAASQDKNQEDRTPPLGGEGGD